MRITPTGNTIRLVALKMQGSLLHIIRKNQIFKLT